MKGILSFIGILAICLLVPVGMMAQSAATAELHVAVKDPKGAVVRSANVTVRNEARNFERASKENTEGEYQFLLLPPGQYQVIVDAAGFAKTTISNVTITVGQRAELPVTLQLASVSETVNVSGEAELIQTQVTSANTTVDQVRIDNLPINGRNYIQFALTDSKIARDTAPSIGAAPTSGLNFSGQRARSNLVNVDGADAVDNSTNGIRSTVSQEAVQEFQIITNGYNAEYGRASGGVVNIITRSGTNDFHGTAFGYLRNRNIQAKPYFSTTADPAYTRYQAGVAAGGPIIKDRTFYYFSYEATRRRESGFSTIGQNNFNLVNFNTAAVGLPFGNVMLTPAQAAFVSQIAPIAAGNASVASFMGNYVVLAGGGAGLGVNRQLPSATMAGALAARYGVTPSLTMFPTSGAQLPASFVGMQSLIGNFPVREETSLYSLRLDHRFSAANNFNVRVGVSPSTATGIQVNAQGPQNFGQNAWSRTSEQQYRDFNVTAQDTMVLGNNKVNEFRFQYARRGLRYNYSSGPGGSNVAVNMAGYGFWGREPFSYVNRTEERYQFLDNFTWTKGSHTIKFGGDVNYLPLTADFTVNFGGLYNFGSLAAGQLMTDTSGNPITSIAGISVPGFSPVQAYGLGIPAAYIQGVGNPHDEFKNKTLGVFLQDSWRLRSNLTMNYGVRYDVEFTPEFAAVNAMSQTAQDALGITQGIPRDNNNVAPRIGFAWDPWSDGKTVVRASYGMFYDHPLLALAFDSDVADGTQAPQIVLFPGSPGGCSLNASNVFQGFPGTVNSQGQAVAACPAANLAPFTYLQGQQRFDPTPGTQSLFTNQNYLTAGVPLVLQPFGFPVAKNFEYGYSHQANLTYEHEIMRDMSLSLEYNYNGGRHLNRPINVNPVRTDLLFQNYFRARNVINALLPSLPANAQATLRGQLAAPELIGICPAMLVGLGVPANTVNALVQQYGNFQPAALMSFFRPSGINPSLTAAASPVAPCAANTGLPNAGNLLQEYGLGLGVTVPFSDMPANFSDGTSVYHGFTANVKKRMRKNYEFLFSYTWSHAIDDGTDLQSPLSPQDSFRPYLERGNSLFDQRHRLVFSSVYDTGKLSNSGWKRFFNDWTIAPVIEISSGRPFNIVTFTDRNHDLSTGTDRPNAVPAGTATNACGDPVVPSEYSPTGYFQLPCDFAGQYTGNLGRNTGVKPWTYFTDLRVAKRMNLTERLKLEGIMDVFNLINTFNVADVNPLYTSAGQPTAAFDPRQFQFALKLTW
ncbi:MAG TPA: TonB-dependent receptor [Terriglobales bacterium]|nr:TonB-dependent receptor [Terriglobales bacterium]